MNLIEVLIAMAIFATALLVIVGLFPTAARAVRQAQTITVATDLASQRMEEALATPFDQVTDSLTTVSMASRSAGQPAALDYTVQTLVSRPQTDLERIEVLVGWTTDTARMVRLQTYRVRLH